MTHLVLEILGAFYGLLILFFGAVFVSRSLRDRDARAMEEWRRNNPRC